MGLLLAGTRRQYRHEPPVAANVTTVMGSGAAGCAILHDLGSSLGCESRRRLLRMPAHCPLDTSELGQAMWQHLENIKEMLFKASTIEDENELDYYLFAASQSEMP
jgi:hypothetical protein